MLSLKKETLELLPALLKLLHRCQLPYDVTAIQKVLRNYGVIVPPVRQQRRMSRLAKQSTRALQATPSLAPVPQAFDVIGETSFILNFLIKTSEVWTYPTPSWATQVMTYQDAVFPQAVYEDYAMNCVYGGDLQAPSYGAIGSTDAILNNFGVSELAAFKYETDEYYGKFATTPDHASVLVINGKLDFQTMSDNGVRQYNNMHGGRGKHMIEMPYGGHCSGVQTECGLRIIASYVGVSGNLDMLDVSCVAQQPKIELWSADGIVAYALTQPTQPQAAATSVRKASKTVKLKLHHGKLTRVN